MQSTYTVIESQADWATLTSNGHPRDSRLFEWGRAVMRAEEAKGGKRIPWALRGYAGEHCGHISVGERDGSDIVQLSGQAACDHLKEGFARCSSITRLDLAVTTRVGGDSASHEWEQWVRFVDWRDKFGADMKGRFMVDAVGGATAYIGSRKSELFLRIYDKAAECREARDLEGAEHYERCHRYELEMKGERCRKTAQELLSAPNAPGLVIAWVSDYLHRHGMYTGPIGDEHMQLVRGFRRRTDTETRLRWLEEQVQPTIEWLRYHGNEARVFAALGYDALKLAKYLERDGGNAAEAVES